MLPIFGTKIFSKSIGWVKKNTGKCCPFLSQNFSPTSIDGFISQKQGEMLPRFFSQNFSPASIDGLSLFHFFKSRGKCCPFFSDGLLVLKPGGHAARFCQRIFLLHRLMIFRKKKNRGKCCPFLSQKFSPKSIDGFCFKNRGKCCPFLLQSAFPYIN